MQAFKNILLKFIKFLLLWMAFICTIIILFMKGCEYYSINLIKKNIPKEFEITDTVYTNVSIGCSVAIFKVREPNVDILKIKNSIFKQFYTGMDFLQIEKDNLEEKISTSILGYKSESGNAIGFGKSCIEDNLLSDEFIKNYYDSKSYITFGGDNGGIVMIYNNTTNQLYYSTAP